MKDALRTSGLFTRIQLGFTNGLLGLPVAISVSHDALSVLGLVAVVAILGILRVGPIAIGLSCAAGFAVPSFFVAINQIFVPNYKFDGPLVLVIVAVVVVSCLIILKRVLPTDTLGIPLIGAGLLALISIYSSWSLHSLLPHESLSLLANSSSSYSEYLSALAQSMSEAGPNLIPASSVHSGPLLGLILVVGRKFVDWMNPDLSALKIENARILIHILLILTAITSSIWFGICAEILKKQGNLKRSMFSVVTAIATALFLIGLAQIGRIDIQISYMFVSIGIWVVILFKDSQGGPQSIGFVLTTALLFGAALSWFPSIWIGIAFLGQSLTRMILTTSRANKEQNQRRRIPLYLIAATGVALFLFFIPYFWRSVSSPDGNFANQTLPGGAMAFYPALVVLVLCASVWLAIQRFDIRNNELISMVLFALVALPALFLVASYFQHPFRPTEGTWLFVYLTMSLLLPLLVGLAVEMFSRDRRNRSQRIVVNLVAMIGLAVAVLPQISNSRTLANQEKRNSRWAERVLAEYQKAPARPVACLNTTLDDVSGDVEAQLCTQMSFRLAGFVAPIYEYWAEATGCTTTVEHATTSFSREMLANLTLILSDPTRTSSMAGCQAIGPNGSNGWLTNIEWPYVRKINISGVEVFPKPTRVGS